MCKEKTIIQIKREEVGLSRAELSRRSSVPIRTLEDWEYGKNLPRDVYLLGKIAKVLNCFIEELIDPDLINIPNG